MDKELSWHTICAEEWMTCQVRNISTAHDANARIDPMTRLSSHEHPEPTWMSSTRRRSLASDYSELGATTGRSFGNLPDGPGRAANPV
ncbi:hypothetical protein N7466_001589 [Penicillium verhagenii]|uniref:uncharacterized protein n=1 Tax=Penicillium verhagenii TaxID=1562060 RepID=UPI002545A5BB|nr:uncharacterized protein N7466_001589 [Penicillium verhagenii]KAJ5938455.1 hypothetical protein N7466_001589 [Penicillium verhagenii]